MADTIIIETMEKNGNRTRYGTVTEFRCEKERYTPYSSLTAEFVGVCDAYDIAEVSLYIGSRLVHRGTADVIESRNDGGSYRIKVRSYGYTKQLGQNFSEEGIISQPDLDDVMKRCGVPFAECQQGTDRVNYVYINDKTTAWEAICVYAMKAYRTSPFIRGDNVVCCTADTSVSRGYTGAHTVMTAKGQKLTGIYSDVYVAGLSGSYDYHAQSSTAQSHRITRRKYYPYDREWVYDLNDEAAFYLNYSERGTKYSAFRVQGYRGEDLLDKATISAGGLSLDEAEIDAVIITASGKGIFTEIRCYEDAYCG
ncbi:MAG: hypothetical protein J6M17_00495 [Ruminococcus sp.]|nr:hypothetical protein [Ruminococcus sp.]